MRNELHCCCKKLGISINTVKSYCRRNNVNKSVCKNCGKVVEQTLGRKEKKFCGDACRMAWWKARLNELKILIEELVDKLEAMGGNRFAGVALTKEYQDLVEYTEEHDKLQQSIVDRRTRATKIELFMKNLEPQEGPIQAYDETLWNRLVEKMVVTTKDDVSLVFRDGSVVKC